MKRRWTLDNLKLAVSTSNSIRQVLSKLGLKEAGGNYKQINKFIDFYQIDNSHFTGRAWSKGLKIKTKPRIGLPQILIKSSVYQSYKLKRRLFLSGLKKQSCEECGWARISNDGRIPLELHHINGDSHDNRIENLQVLCPNCHSLKPNHRGKNIRN